ncbi:MAG: hypothetical protein ACKKL4_00800 [Patescibacteria group bacterium]
MTNSIPSKLGDQSLYRKEHRVLLGMFEMYQNSSVIEHLSFAQYFDSLMRLDSARHNHEIHNFFKTEHSLQEHFPFADIDDISDDIL